MKTLLISAAAAAVFATSALAAEPKTPGAFLEVTLKIDSAQRGAAVEVYKKYKAPFLTTTHGARSKELLVRDEDVQVLHGFDRPKSGLTPGG